MRLCIFIYLALASVNAAAFDKKQQQAALLACKSLRYVSHGFPTDGGSVIFRFLNPDNLGMSFLVMALHNTKQLGGDPASNKFFFLDSWQGTKRVSIPKGSPMEKQLICLLKKCEVSKFRPVSGKRPDARLLKWLTARISDRKTMTTYMDWLKKNDKGKPVK